VKGEVVPADATITAKRRTTPLFGLGLVDAVADQTFIDLAQQEANDPDGIAGHVAMVTNLATGQPAVGKFGWKSQVPALSQFAGDAYLNEMGITSPLFPLDNCPQGDCSLRHCDGKADPEDDGTDIKAFTEFMTLLAPPASHQHWGHAATGAAKFKSIGCASCHVPDLATAKNAIAALSEVTFHPYSDFLLHDMGELGDGIVQGDASAREMRTSPLWGIGRQSAFLHDGRAKTLEKAILAHAGKAQPARDRFAALGAGDRTAVVAFLNDL
jgi:CxxC motif-containing protein (DUF1111 family)